MVAMRTASTRAFRAGRSPEFLGIGTGVHDLDVLVVGPYPPPYGGVSAHLSQLLMLLPSEGLRVAGLNHYGDGDADEAVVGALRRNPLRYWWRLRRPTSRVVHYHFSRLSDLVAVAAAHPAGDPRGFVITVHGHTLADALESPYRVRRHLARRALARFDAVIAVSAQLASELRPHVDGIDLAVVPAYMGSEACSGELADAAARVMECCRPTLVVAAYQLRIAQDGTELYGTDTAVAAFIRLALQEPALGLVLYVAKPVRGRRAKRFVQEQRRLVVAAGLQDRFAICVGEALAPAFAQDVVFLRPTLRDGDAVSVREALQAGAPVIASDIAPRPTGVRLVPAADPAALAQAVRALVRSPDPAPRAGRGDGHLAGVVGVYARLLGQGGSGSARPQGDRGA